ncbi:5-formyltetrahydrofolate cyclo-ligase [Heliorestis acidaminivorans]|uniref:5-formyltetrahydrofolate cyclo-ligase n=1 Tax=Heliorestis acidaminivorans TaxID=553427 RepID=A0A6I0EXC5_9FIRM|nr:5-formyltetrahydrofolate cyclo-ligase [Heliorestis acidaminivorans]KAB2951854.1 5-formyltetrahydrofolate cyclo-ligase [Heliorestis acidaminivorans]
MVDFEGIKEQKVKLRASILQKRKQQTIEEQIYKSTIITEKLVQGRDFQEARTVMAYSSFRQEVMTKALLELAWQEGKRVLIPLCQPSDSKIIPCQIDSFDDLVEGTWGILEPSPEKLNPLSPAEIDLVLVPALAFDLQGHRLGYGAGYYDRFLPQLQEKAVKIGLAYELQIIEKLFPEDHDIPVDSIITESRWINCKGRSYR